MSIEKALGMSEEEKHRMAEATRIKLIEREKREPQTLQGQNAYRSGFRRFAETLHARITSAIQVLDMEKESSGHDFRSR